jgi:hypothetical protein
MHVIAAVATEQTHRVEEKSHDPVLASGGGISSRRFSGFSSCDVNPALGPAATRNLYLGSEMMLSTVSFFPPTLLPLPSLPWGALP